MVYAREVDGNVLRFRVSGMLWRNALVLEDRETGTLWSQVTGEAIRGPLAGKRLEALRASHTAWAGWSREHPATEVLRKDRAVAGSAYEAYANDPSRFGITRTKAALRRLPGKTLVYGVSLDGAAVAVPDGRIGAEPVAAAIGDRTVRFVRRPDGSVGAAEASTGLEIPVTKAYWFAWVSFYPASGLVGE